MFGFQIAVIIIAALAAVLWSLLPEKLEERLMGFLGLAGVVFVIACVIEMKIMFGLTTLILIGVSFGFVRGIIKKEVTVSLFITYGVVVLAILFVNRGIKDRVYDTADAIPFIEEYNINHQLRYAKTNDISKESDAYTIYIATIKETDDEEREKEIITKIKKKAGYENYYIVKLYYNKKDLKSVGYAYNMPRHEVPDIESVCAMIGKKVDKDGVIDSVEYIVQCVEGGGAGYTQEDGYVEYDEELPTDDEVGVHWVDGYTRQDGTEVDGYWRTNPDGDPTNNFSYDGNSGNYDYNYYDNYDYYNSYDSYDNYDSYDYYDSYDAYDYDMYAE